MKVFTMEKPKRPRWNGAALRALRKAKGWTPEDLAKAVGSAKSQVYKWEEGDKKGPGVDYIAAFSILFNQPVDAFVIGTDDYRQFAIGFDPRADEKFQADEASRRKKRESELEPPIEFIDPSKVSALPPGPAPRGRSPKGTDEPTPPKKKPAPKSPKPTDK